jgi:hypothetical protein
MRMPGKVRAYNSSHDQATATMKDDNVIISNKSLKKFNIENKKQSCPFGCYLCKILGSDYLDSRYTVDCIIDEKNKAIFDPLSWISGGGY